VLPRLSHPAASKSFQPLLAARLYRHRHDESTPETRTRCLESSANSPVHTYMLARMPCARSRRRPGPRHPRAARAPPVSGARPPAGGRGAPRCARRDRRAHSRRGALSAVPYPVRPSLRPSLMRPLRPAQEAYPLRLAWAWPFARVRVREESVRGFTCQNTTLRKPGKHFFSFSFVTRTSRIIACRRPP